jgi:hypothetical protein
MTEKTMKGLFGGGEAEGTPAQQQASREERREARREARGGGGGGGRRRRELSQEEAVRAQDFVQRYTTGSPTEGFSSEEAVGYLRELRQDVPPEVLQRAAVATVQNLPDDQRKQFAEMLQRRQQGTGMVTIERTGQAHAAEGRGAAQGGDAGMDDMLGGLFGNLFGGGMAQPEPQPMPRSQQAPGGLGMDDMLGGLLGSLLGGGAAPAPQGNSAPAGDPFGDILGSLLGGEAALPSPQPAPRQTQAQQEQGGGIGDILGSPLGKAVLGGIAAYAMKEMMDKGQRG